MGTWFKSQPAPGPPYPRPYLHVGIEILVIVLVILALFWITLRTHNTLQIVVEEKIDSKLDDAIPSNAPIPEINPSPEELGSGSKSQLEDDDWMENIVHVDKPESFPDEDDDSEASVEDED